jgi:transposase
LNKEHKNQDSPPPQLFIGIDMHKKTWALHFKSDVCDHKGMSIEADPEILIRYVEKNFPSHEVHLTYEACCCGFSSARTFLNLGWQVKVINPADIPKSNKQLYQKTDKIDSRYLCDLLKSNQLKGIYVPTESEEQLCAMLRERNQITKSLRVTKNRIKSSLLFHGIVIPVHLDNPNWSIAFKTWLKEIKFSNISGQAALNCKLRQLDFLHTEYLEMANQLRAYCRKYLKKDYYLLKSVPGVGGYVACAILAEAGNLRRFNNVREFSSFVGVVPGVHQSADTNKSMGITPRCRSLLRTYIIEAAWVALRHDPELQMYYRTHYGKNVKCIIVKIAHKLLKRIYHVVKNETPYVRNFNLTETDLKLVEATSKELEKLVPESMLEELQ